MGIVDEKIIVLLRNFNELTPANEPHCFPATRRTTSFPKHT